MDSIFILTFKWPLSLAISLYYLTCPPLSSSLHLIPTFSSSFIHPSFDYVCKYFVVYFASMFIREIYLKFFLCCFFFFMWFGYQSILSSQNVLVNLPSIYILWNNSFESLVEFCPNIIWPKASSVQRFELLCVFHLGMYICLYCCLIWFNFVQRILLTSFKFGEVQFF